MTLKYDRLKYRQEGILYSYIRKLTKNRSMLVKYLHGYPEYTPPYKQESIDLSVSQAKDNFEYFMKVKSDRIVFISKLLSTFSLNINPEKVDRDSLLRLDEWAYQQWPAIYDKYLARDGLFLFTFNNTKLLKIRSMLLDLSILLGECYLNLCPNSKWYLDSGLESSDEQRGSCNRIVIIETKELNQKDEWNYKLDIEAHVFGHFELQTKTNNLLLVDQKMGYVLSKPVLDILKN